MNPHKVILAGGTGFLGQVLIDHWKNPFTELIVLSRQPRPSHNNVRYVEWDGKTIGPWAAELEGADAVINLAGRSVDCRYTEANRRAILTSRTDSTAVLGKAIWQCSSPPRCWINAASATIYRHAMDRPMDEETGEMENDFSVQVCKSWEQTFWSATVPPSVRRICLRVAIVLGRGGGVLPVLQRLAQVGLGGTMGGGNQYVSWLHERDFARIIDYALTNEHLTGTFNASAPGPVRNRDFMRVLRNACGVWFGLPATAWMLEIGAFFLQTETELILKSRNVVPKKLLEAGFEFEFPTVEKALDSLA